MVKQEIIDAYLVRRIMGGACRHFLSCSGCEVHLDEKEPAIWAEVNSFFERPVPLVLESRPHWRMRAKLAVREGKDRKGALGLFRRQSHELVEIPDCIAHHPSINQAAHLIRREMELLQIRPYDEKSREGSLRYVQCFVCRKTGRVQLTLVSQCRKEAERLAEKLSRTSDLWHSIWVNVNAQNTNAIFGGDWICLFGEPFMHQQIGRASIAFHPASFSQAHLSLFDRLLEKVESWVSSETRLLEVYAGAGAISLSLLPKIASAILVEENPYAHLSYLSSNPPPHFRYHLGDAKESIQHIDNADLILLDPPRKGIDPDLLGALQRVDDKQLIYISCSFTSFERDAKKLLESGWKLIDAAGFWLFPGANHIELASHWKKPAR